MKPVFGAFGMAGNADSIAFISKACPASAFSSNPVCVDRTLLYLLNSFP